MQRETFRTVVLAAALAFQAQGRMLPNILRRAGQRLGSRTMRWLDERRDKLDADVLP